MLVLCHAAFSLFITVLLTTCFMPDAFAAPGGIMVGKTMYLSGQGSRTPDGKLPDTFSEEVRQCLENIRSNLEKAGLDMENVVKSFVYLDDIGNFGAMNEVYKQYFKKNPPARTTVGVKWIPGGSHVETTCIAYSDLSEKKCLGTEKFYGLPFSPGVIAGKTLYIAGQGDHIDEDASRPPTFEDQVKNCMAKVESVLKMAGLDWRHVVWSNVYLDYVGYANLGRFNKAYSEYFEFGDEPARTTIFADGLPYMDYNIEITCIATTDLSNRKVVRPPNMKYGPDGRAITASPGVWAGDTLYLSTQNGADPETGVVSADLEAQTRQMLQNHLDVLSEAGLKFEDIVSGNVNLRDGDDYRPFNSVYHPHFSKSPGVRTCVRYGPGFERSVGGINSRNVRAETSFIFARDKK